MTKKFFALMAFSAGLIIAPLTGGAFAQNELPNSATLNSLAQGNAPDPATKQQLKQIENALKQNMQSSELLMRAAKAAGASPQDLAEMERMSVGFMKLFLTSLTPPDLRAPGTPPTQPKARPGQPMPPQNATPPMGKQPPVPGMPPVGQRPPQGAPGMGMPQAGQPPLAPGQGMGVPPVGQRQPMPPQGMPPRQAAPQAKPAPEVPQGYIIIAPDGTQWLVTPKAQQPVPAGKATPARPQGQRPSAIQAPPMAPEQVAPAQGAPQQGNPVIIIEEETITEDMPLWPTKEQLGKDGVLKYLEKRGAGK